MARSSSLIAISNSLVSSEQLLRYRQSQDTPQNADKLVFRLSLLTQTAGILLRLPQEVIAVSIVLLQRHLLATSSDLTFTSKHDLDEPQPGFHPESDLITTSSAAVFVAAKQSFYPLSPRSIINVFALLTSTTSSPLSFVNPLASQTNSATSPSDPKSYFVSEGTYQSRRERLFTAEKTVLVSLGFDTKVVLPYSLSLTYLQVLSIATSDASARVLAHLNTALLSPQYLYLTHQPNALAVAAIYLAAREQGIAVADEEVAWWEVFDVGREELGFLVLSMASVNDFVRAQELEEPTKAT